MGACEARRVLTRIRRATRPVTLTVTERIQIPDRGRAPPGAAAGL